MTEEKKLAARDKAQRINLSRSAVFGGAIRKPGRYTDKDFPSLGLQVSPKLKAVWFARFRDSAGLEHRLTKKGVAAHAGLADGLTSFDYEQAKAWAIAQMQQANKSPDQRAAEVADAEYSTLAKVWDTFLRDRRTRGGQPLSPATKTDYTKWYRAALQPVKDLKLTDVSVTEWTKFLGDVDTTHGKSKALYMLNIVSAVYSFLMGLDKADVNPMTKVRLRRLFIAPTPRARHLPAIRLRSFYQGIDVALTRRDSKDALKLLFMSGMRLSGALGMRWDQLNLDEGFYYVLPGQAGWKGFTGVVPLSDYVIELLRSRKGRDDSQVPYIFPKRHGTSSPPHLSRVSDALKTVCMECDLPRVSAHDLRRTFASAARLRFGAEIDKVAVLLTHKWAVDDRNMVVSASQITKQYIQHDLTTLRTIANDAAEFLLELVGERPMSEKTAERLKQAGHSVDDFKLLSLPEGGEESALLQAA